MQLEETAPTGGLLSPSYALTTIGLFALIAFNAFEAMAVTTVMPIVGAELDGLALYALAFAAPLAAGVVGMVVAGLWSDRAGPVPPLLVSLVMFAVGLLVCGLAPSMEVLVVGRVLQGLGGGALTVGLYVVVGLVYPRRLQPAIFASFAAAWVLPALIGPALAAGIEHLVGWRWVFLSVVLLVGGATVLVLPALKPLRRSTPSSTPDPTARRRLGWATVAAVAVLAVELLGSRTGLVALLAVLAGVVVVLALRPLLPTGTLLARRGLPAVIATRGLLSAAFFAAEAFIAFALQESWGLSAARAGLALTAVGVLWAVASQVQGRLGDRIADETCLRVGTTVVLLGVLLVVVATALDAHPLLAGGSYALAGLGMGFAYPRTSTAMLAATTEQERGFHASALTIADSLGAALALAVAGVVHTAARRAEIDPFLPVFVAAAVIALLGVVAARRTSGGTSTGSRG